jgi:hypothetical protein
MDRRCLCGGNLVCLSSLICNQFCHDTHAHLHLDTSGNLTDNPGVRRVSFSPDLQIGAETQRYLLVVRHWGRLAARRGY